MFIHLRQRCWITCYMWRFPFYRCIRIGRNYLTSLCWVSVPFLYQIPIWCWSHSTNPVAVPPLYIQHGPNNSIWMSHILHHERDQTLTFDKFSFVALNRLVRLTVTRTSGCVGLHGISFLWPCLNLNFSKLSLKNTKSFLAVKKREKFELELVLDKIIVNKTNL